MPGLVFAGVEWIKFAVFIIIALVWLIRNLSSLIKGTKSVQGRSDSGAAADQLQGEIEKFLRQAQDQREGKVRPVAVPPPPPPRPDRQSVAQERIERKKRESQERRPNRPPAKKERVERQAPQSRLSQRHTIDDEVHRHLDTDKFQRHTAELSNLDDDSKNASINIHDAYDKRMAESDMKMAGSQTRTTAMEGRMGSLIGPKQFRNAIILQEILRNPFMDEQDRF